MPDHTLLYSGDLRVRVEPTLLMHDIHRVSLSKQEPRSDYQKPLLGPVWLSTNASVPEVKSMVYIYSPKGYLATGFKP